MSAPDLVVLRLEGAERRVSASSAPPPGGAIYPPPGGAIALASSPAPPPSLRAPPPHLSDPRTESLKWQSVRLGSPPLKKDPGPIFSFKGGEGRQEVGLDTRARLQRFEKPQSLDIDAMAPQIKITPMSDLESDTDSPLPCTLPGMDYLSPFALVAGSGCHLARPVSSCGSRATSESNLSSSGYSSGTSRCGSSNPLCISESEENSTPTSAATFFPSHTFVRRPSPLLKSPSCDSESSDQTLPHRYRTRPTVFARYRTDSETTDDQNTGEAAPGRGDSNDEGIGGDETAAKAETPWTLPEIVVQACFTIPEQESTESTKSSRHNSMDDPAKSSSSSRSSSPVGSSLQPSESEREGGGRRPEEEGGRRLEEGKVARKGSPRRRGRRRKQSRSSSPAPPKAESPREGSSVEKKVGQRRLRSQARVEEPGWPGEPPGWRREAKEAGQHYSSSESLNTPSCCPSVEPPASYCSSHSSSDESEEEETVVLAPAPDLPTKTSSSSTSTSHTSSPLGSLLTLLPLPSKPKSSSTRPRHRKKKSPEKRSQLALGGAPTSTDSMAAAQDPAQELGEEGRLKVEQTDF